MDQAKLEELAPDIADEFTASAVNNAIDNMPKPIPGGSVVDPTRQQIVALWNLFSEGPSAIRLNGGFRKMAKTVGIKPGQCISLLKQMKALVAYRKSEATPAPAKKAKASK